MKALLPLLLLLLLGACVTPGELARLGGRVDNVRLAVEDRESSWADIGARVDELDAELEDVEAAVDERTSGYLTAGEAAGGGSVLLSLGLLALNRLRDRNRRKRGEPVTGPASS